ncbi:mitochondrial distribution and morphology [Microbotryomycetes sp. JL201]|nr:mitochondrial distribution and morphology [Microbotryomycetes sp. JL201]
MAGVLQLVNNLIIKTKLSGNLLHFRTLQPIYAAIEVSNERLALQLCAKALKRQPNDPLVLALKALALVLSKSSSSATAQEVSQLVRQIRIVNDGAALSDPDMITLLSWILSAIGYSAETPALLAEAVQKHPNNEHIVSEAFLQNVRSNNFANAQQLGIRLQRDFRQQPQYLWWSVLATLLLVRHGQDSVTNKSLVLSLAERQISSKYAKEQKDQNLERNGTTEINHRSLDDSGSQYENSHEFFVVTSLLEAQAEEEDRMQQENAQDIAPKAVIRNLPSLPKQALSARQALLAHFASTEGEKWCKGSLEMEIRRRQAELRWGSSENETWDKACKRMSQQLKTGDTNWHTMLFLVRCAFARADAGAAHATQQSTIDSAVLIANARELFEELSRTSSKAKTERGFPLALLEIARETRKRKWQESDSMKDLVRRYCDQFSTKSCCFDDLKPYIEALATEESREFVKSISVEEDGDNSLHKAARAINAAKFQRVFSNNLSAEQESDAMTQLLQSYFAALPLGKLLPQTELQPADDFAVLAAESCVSAFHVSKDRSWLERAIAILGFVVSKSKYRYQARILLINIARLLGAPSLAITHFRALNLKSIQLDTLSHLVLTRAATFGVVDHAKGDSGLLAIAASAARFHEIGSNEATEMVVRALHLNTYSKVDDFVGFTDRLRRSLSHQLASMETLRLQVVRNALDDAALGSAESYLEQMRANWHERVSDNRDFKTLPNFQPRNSADIWEQSTLGPRTGTEWLRTFVVIYSNFLSGTTTNNESDLLGANEITSAEASLLQLSRHARAAFEASADNAEGQEKVLAYFKDQAIELASMLEDDMRLPWEIIHIVQMAFEGYCLLEIGIDVASARLAATKAPDYAKRTKQLRALRITARDEMKAIGAKVTNFGKKVGKERNKTVGNMSWLQSFPALNEDYLTNVAHTLVESRRTMAEGLGSAIHRKCSR